MKKQYLYKNIKCFQSYGRWYADYSDGKMTFGLHRASCGTKADAYEIAKAQVDYLNNK